MPQLKRALISSPNKDRLGESLLGLDISRTQTIVIIPILRREQEDNSRGDGKRYVKHIPMSSFINW